MSDPLVFQSDFGLADGAVAAMFGVALSVDPQLRLFNLTHDITPYDIWEASYRLFQSVEYWPPATVFVSVVDPGVGSTRRSVVALTADGHTIVTPDNGTLTHLAKYVGVTALREISEVKHRREHTENSFTFHGRDVYAFIGAKLASGAVNFDDVGPELPLDQIVTLPLGDVVCTPDSVKGCIDILDVRFGSPWTNVTREQFLTLGIGVGEPVEIEIRNGPTRVYNNRATYGRSFADVSVGEQIVYVNSLYRMAVAINQGSFARAYNVGTGTHWSIEFRRPSTG